MSKVNLNAFPYYDDYDEAKGFHKVLFHPGKPVQARELTQLQTILQEQIKRNGDHMFKNGTMVIPGHVFYDDKVKFLKLVAVYDQVSADDMLDSIIDKTIVGDTNNIEAVVVHATPKTTADATTLYIKYLTSADNIKEFRAGETLTVKEVPGLVLKIQAVTAKADQPGSGYTGPSSIVSIGDGVFYVNGYFVKVDKQTVVLSKYSNTPSAVVGLNYVESVVTENEDETLYDNAFGFTNYGAPGAHRLKIALTLVSKPYSYTVEDTGDVNFIDLLKVKAGKIEYLKNDTKYAEIEKWLARRTFEESGNYIVKPFTFRASDYRNNNRGVWAPNTPYLAGDIVTTNSGTYVATNTGYSSSTTPAHAIGIRSDGYVNWLYTSNINKWVNLGKFAATTSTSLADHIADEEKMVVISSPGKGYINGFEVDIPNENVSVISKARELKDISNTEIYTPTGNYVTVYNVRGIPNLADDLNKCNIKDVSGTTIGTAFIRNVELVSTAATSAAYTFRVFLFNLSMNVGYDFATRANSIASIGGNFSATVVPKLTNIVGSVSTTATDATVVGVGTQFDFDFKAGQRIKIDNTIYTILSITNPLSMEVSPTPSATATGVRISLVESKLVSGAPYVTKIVDAVKTLRDTSGNIDTTYVINKAIPFTASSTTHVLTLTNGETFLPPSDHYVIVDTGTLNTSIIETGATFTLSGDSTQLTIGGLTNAVSYKLNAQVRRTGVYAKEKIKTLSSKTITINNTGIYAAGGGLIQSGIKFNDRVLSLTEADVVSISKITMSGDATDKVNYVSAGETVITNWYTLNNGQTDEYYGISKIVANKTAGRPIKVTFEYFQHSDGDYFSVDSYASVNKRLLPKYTSRSGETLYLADCLDFRSRISDNGNEFKIATGGSVSEPISSESTIRTSYSYYLPRADVIYLSESGRIVYKENNSTITDGAALARVYVPASTIDPRINVKFDDVQVKSYTMNEIGDIDNRVKTVEYYVALSLLEQDAVNTVVVDEFGLEKTKYGFVVDDFSIHSVGDIENRDYLCSIDEEENTVRAICTRESVSMIEPYGASPSYRTANHYAVTGAQATLPYIEEELIIQKMASRSEKIQGFTSLTYEGKLDVFPAADIYEENVTSLTRVDTFQTVNIDTTNTTISYVYRTNPAAVALPAPTSSAQTNTTTTAGRGVTTASTITAVVPRTGVGSSTPNS